MTSPNAPSGLTPTTRLWLAGFALGVSLIALGMVGIDLIHKVPDDYRGQHLRQLVGAIGGVSLGLAELVKRPAIRPWLVGLAITLATGTLALLVLY